MPENTNPTPLWRILIDEDARILDSWRGNAGDFPESRDYPAGGVAALGRWLKDGDAGALVAALRAPPWGDGSEPHPRAAALVPAFELAVIEIAGDTLELRQELSKLLAQLLRPIGAAAERREQRLMKIADADSLTGTLNRGAVVRELEREAARAERYDRDLSVLFMDVADLKKTNDREGHVAGDRLLTTLASIVQANTRSADLLGRMGGDEFLLVMPETDSAQAETVARKLIALLAEGTTDGPPVRVSVGVAGSPEIEHVSEALIAAADKALVAAKRGDQQLVVAEAAGGS